MLTSLHAAQQSTTIVFPNWLATLLTSLFLLALLVKLGGSISRYIKIDDLLRVFIAVFGVAGSLYATPRFHTLALSIKDWADRSFGNRAHTYTTIGVIFLIIIIGFALGAYLKQSTWLRLGAVVLLTIPLFTNVTMQKVALWFSDHIGSWLFRFIIHLFNILAGT